MTLEKGNAFAVFLPQVAPEQGWDLEKTLSYLSQKAKFGIIRVKGNLVLYLWE